MLPTRARSMDVPRATSFNLPSMCQHIANSQMRVADFLATSIHVLLARRFGGELEEHEIQDEV